MVLNVEIEKGIFEAYASELEKSMDRRVDPNEDFIKYCCGSYNKDNYNKLPRNLKEATKMLLENESITHSCIVKARNFYKSVGSINDFKEFLETNGLYSKIGGLPAFEENWNGEKFDFINLTGTLCSIGLQSVVTHSLHYLEGGERLIKVSLNNFNEESVEEIFRKLNISEQRVQEAIDDIKKLKDQVSNKRCEYQFELLKIRPNCMSCTHTLTVDDLNKYPEFDFKKYFEICLGYPLDEKDMLKVENLSFLRNCIALFSQCGARAAANYVTWLAAGNFFERDYKLNLIKHHFISAILATVLNIYFTESDEVKRQDVVDRFVRSIEERNSQLDEEMKEALKSDVVLEMKELLKSIYSIEKINEEYEGLEINPARFYENILNIRKHGVRNGQKKYYTKIPIRKHFYEPYLGKIDSFIERIICCHNKPMLHYFSMHGNNILGTVKYCTIINRDQKLMAEAREFLIKQAESRNLSFGHYTADHVLSNLAVLKDIHKEYERWLNENEALKEIQEDYLTNYNLNNIQLLFIDFVKQCHCLGETQHETDGWILLTLLNYPKLSDSFGFKIGSKMNPEIKCNEEWYSI